MNKDIENCTIVNLGCMKKTYEGRGIECNICGTDEYLYDLGYLKGKEIFKNKKLIADILNYIDYSGKSFDDYLDYINNCTYINIQNSKDIITVLYENKIKVPEYRFIDECEHRHNENVIFIKGLVDSLLYNIITENKSR